MTGGAGALPAGSGGTAPSPGSAPADAVAFTGALPTTSGTVQLGISGAMRDVAVVLPSARGTNPPLIIAFHGTGGSPSDLLDDPLVQGADRAGIILAAPQALERNGGNGEPMDPDHYEGGSGWSTSWNMTSKSVDANNDVQLVRAIIQAARAAYAIDTDRVYVMGFSNGAFFSYFLAAMMPDRITAFAENSGGAIRCVNRESEGMQFIGTGTSCPALATMTGFPTCTGPLQPLAVPARIPLGYLAHAIDDETVSVAWTCTLASALGDRAWVHLQTKGLPFGHAITEDFSIGALAFFSRYRRQD
jgi:dienelactone hydrolase